MEISSVTPKGVSHNPGGVAKCEVLFNRFVSSASDELPVSDYRLAPALGVRFVGALLVLMAVVLFAATMLVVVLNVSPDLVIVMAAVGLLAVFGGGYLITQRIPVVRLGPDGYRVRLVRGAGVTEATWKEVQEAVTTTSATGEPVLEMRLRDGRRTTIPVLALAADREEFARDVIAHLRRGQGIRPL